MKKPYLSGFMKSVFKGICKQYLWILLLEDKSPVGFSDLGRWWGAAPGIRKKMEIIHSYVTKDMPKLNQRWPH
ncbi:DUF234 domain-containing protein [Anaerotruncus colihominis]|uniref:DUF234 domain-containing protein n=1 Tax=Anaerotruncus colihominis TaxID=169435 RepID=UPI001898EF8D